MNNDENFNLEDYSDTVQKDVQNDILRDLFISYIDSNDTIDKFSNWCLAISGSMLPLFLLNADKLSEFYSNLNSKTLIYLLLLSSLFGLYSKYLGFKIDLLKPSIKYFQEDGPKKIYNKNLEKIKILKKAGIEFNINDEGLKNNLLEFKKALNPLSRIFLFIREFLNPDIKNYSDLNKTHKKATKLVSIRNIILTVQTLFLLISFFYLVVKFN